MIYTNSGGFNTTNATHKSIGRQNHRLSLDTNASSNADVEKLLNYEPVLQRSRLSGSVLE